MRQERERDSHRAQSEPRGPSPGGSNPRQLEDLHQKLDRANIELKNMSEENERLEIESRKFRNQLDHSKTLLDAAFEVGNDSITDWEPIIAYQPSPQPTI